jgi:hypothetical protein
MDGEILDRFEVPYHFGPTEDLYHRLYSVPSLRYCYVLISRFVIKTVSQTSPVRRVTSRSK